MSPLTKRRLANFRANRRGYWSLWIFLVLFVISLFAEFIANDRPLLVRYEGHFYFPVFVNYTEKVFGGDLPILADYRDPVVAKRIDGAYIPGERAMLKVKEIRTADCVVGGFRHASGSKLVGSLLLANTGSTPITTTDAAAPLATAAVTPCCTLSPSLARGTAEAVVAIDASTRGGSQTGCGVVVGDGVVVTTVAAVGGRHSVRVVSATGRSLQAIVAATDKTSGIALLHLAATLPTAHLGSTDRVAPGTDALALAVRRMAGKATPLPVWTSGKVVSVGRPVSWSGASGTRSASAEMPASSTTTSVPTRIATTGMAEITMHGRSIPNFPGEPLVDAHGRVIGILNWARGAQRAFLPMSFVAGVSTDLETTGQVRHGWLGVTDTTPRDGRGALVLWVDPHGAAARALRPGDVIVRLDGRQVRSSAQLRSMLYVMAPGTKVTVQVEHGSRLLEADLELAASP